MRFLFLTLSLLVGLLGCDESPTTGHSTKVEMAQTEANHERLVHANPPPKLTSSLERANLVKRLERWNDPNKVSYIYLINYGKIFAFFPIKGKVSSVNSLLTTPAQFIDDPHGSFDAGSLVLPSPDLDGSYGENGAAVFFFTTEDVYIEWAGDYMLADQPLKLEQPPQVTYEVKKR